MKIRPTPEWLPVSVVVDGWNQKSIRADPEYQRGRAWRNRQQALLVDSVLRGYPLPRFYFYAETSRDPLGNPSSSFFVIDGLQRITALSESVTGRYPLLDPDRQPDYFPPAIRVEECPWAGLYFDDLPPQLQSQLLETQLPVVLIDEGGREQIRDLFIRLQAGTALTRQQVRDAWPGTIGPYVESLGGRLTRRPRFSFLSRTDRRGARRDDEDELDDPYHDSRTTCAQLLRLHLYGGPASVNARALDRLYHTQTSFDTKGETAQQFERILHYCGTIVEDFAPVVSTKGGSPAKVTKPRLYSLFLTLDELDHNPNLRVDRDLREIARVFWDVAYYDRYEDEPKLGKSGSAARIAEHFHWFLHEVVPDAKLIYLDPQRDFNQSQRGELFKRAEGVCELCKQPLYLSQDVDYDHRIPWIRGGRTTLDNGRAVHQACNRRRGEAVDEVD